MVLLKTSSSEPTQSKPSEAGESRVRQASDVNVNKNEFSKAEKAIKKAD
jgi:hypothetical protein